MRSSNVSPFNITSSRVGPEDVGGVAELLGFLDDGGMVLVLIVEKIGRTNLDAQQQKTRSPAMPPG